MNDTLKAAWRIGAELGAAKAENDRLRGLLREVIACQSAHYGDGCGLHLSMITLAGRIKDALSQQPEPTDTYTAVDMATAAAQGFRDGQAAVEQAAAQDETEPVYQFQWREIGEGDWMACSHSWFRFCEASPEHDTRVVEVARPAQTAPQGKLAIGDRVRKTSGSEWQGRICGTYSTALTPEGYAVESEAHAGSVQIYPAKALEAVE